MTVDRQSKMKPAPDDGIDLQLPPIEERPLVTFAVFAYNQEKYIREAVEGAFAQTYEPLEIILSDDCSTDRTFEIMQEMAAAYKGPHDVKARQSVENVGTLAHVLHVANEASGKYLVVAAGDDISKSERTEITIKIMNEYSLAAISAASDEFCDNILSVIRRRNPVEKIHDTILIESPLVQQIHGATAAYSVDFLREIPIPNKVVLLEDYAFRVIAYWYGKEVSRIDDSVIFHRIHDNNIGPKSYRAQKTTALEQELFLCMHFNRLKLTLEYLIDVYYSLLHKNPKSKANEYPISQTTCEYVSLRSTWMDHSLTERLRFLIVSRNFDSPRRDLLRALGKRFYLMASFALSKL